MLSNLLESCGPYVGAWVSLGIGWLLQSTMLIAVGLLAAQVFRTKGAAVQSAIYRATFVAVLACPVVSLLLSAAGLPVLHLPTAFSTTTPQRSGETPPGAMETALATDPGVRHASAPDRIGADVQPAAQSPQAINLQMQDNPPDADMVLAKPTIDGALLIRLSLAVAWFIGSSVLMVRLFMGWRVSRQLQRSACPADSQAIAQCRSLAARMGVRAPEVLWSALTASPVLVGIWRPVVVLPEEENLTADNNDVLAHELAHLGRWDLVWGFVGRVGTAAFFFQPLIWLLMRRMALAAEEVCDDYVIHLGFDRPGYARRLVEVAERHQPAELFAVGMVSLRSWLSQRVVRILDSSRQLSTRTDRRAGVLIVVAALVGTLLVGSLSAGAVAQPSVAEPAEAAPLATKPAEEKQGPTYKGAVVDKDTGKPVEAGGAKQITNSIGMKLTLIPAGEFMMGTLGSENAPTGGFFAGGAGEPEEDLFPGEGPRHRVRITKPFYLGAYHVTVGQFRRFVADSNYQTDAERDGKGGLGITAEGKWAQEPEFTWRNPGFTQTDDHPVVVVSWNDAVAFCAWLSRKEGKTYRLPTEAQWEYACRAGTTTRYWCGDDPETLAEVGNVADATLNAKFPDWTWSIRASDGYVFTAPVGQFKPNAFGLYDMHGNAFQWCSDLYGEDYYGQSPPDDPTGPTSGSIRVQRGGSWNFGGGYCRSAGRVYGGSPGDCSDFLGFRVALGVIDRSQDRP